MSKRRTGLLLVNTGHGKGKTTAAIGTAFRALGHGMRVAVIQFIKGKWRTGERKLGEQMENLTWMTMGNGCTLHGADRSKDREAARLAWIRAQEFLRSEVLDLLVLDEILYAIGLDFVSIEEVVAALETRQPTLHVILTGRSAPPELVEIADQVTEMRSIKHPFKKGGKGQLGVDF
jgi:cob(I)alamin adenosyltransferase